MKSRLVTVLLCVASFACGCLACTAYGDMFVPYVPASAEEVEALPSHSVIFRDGELLVKRRFKPAPVTL